MRIPPRVLLLSLLIGCSRPAQPEPILLGYLATAGESGRRGVQLAVQEVNASEDQVAGKRVALLVPDLDEEGNTTAAVAARLVAVNRVPALIGGADAEQAEAFGRAAQPGGAFVVAPVALPGARLGDNVFPAQLAAADQGTILAQFASKELSADRVAVLVGPEKSHAELATAFTRQFTKDDSTRRVERFEYGPKANSLAVAGEASKKSPQAILIIGNAKDFAQVRGTLLSAKAQVPLLFGGHAVDWVELETDPAAGLVLYGATLHNPEDGTKYRDFAAAYQKEFRQEPDAAARLAYDAANVLFGASRRARFGIREREKLKEELTKVFVVKLADGKATKAATYKLPGK